MASSSSATYGDPAWQYDVILSFRGEDTRKAFVDHLYDALVKKGIITFRDDLDFPKGKPIENINEAIRKSRFALIVFSSNYASSTWCLKETETIYECMKEGKLTVFPIFHHVDPSEVRKQTGKYGEDLKKHERGSGVDKVQRWTAAMKEIANISGWHLQQQRETEFIQEIVEEIGSQLSKFNLPPSSSSAAAADTFGHLLKAIGEFINLSVQCLLRKENMFPTFHHENTSEVEGQNGKHGEGLKKHEEVPGSSGKDKVPRRKAAKKEAASTGERHTQEEQLLLIFLCILNLFAWSISLALT